MFQMTPVVRILLIINVALFAAEELLAFREISEFLSLYSFTSPNFQPYQYITHAFVHADLGHLLSNMIGLFFFGPFIEQQLNSKRFLQLYMVCAIGAALLQSGVSFYENKQYEEKVLTVIEEPRPAEIKSFIEGLRGFVTNEDIDLTNTYLQAPNNETNIDRVKGVVTRSAARKMNIMRFLGASGAIFGLLMVMFLLFPNLKLQLLFPPIPIKAKFLVGFYALYEIYKMVENNPNDNVAHFAHIAGMLFSFIMIKLIWKMRQVY